MAKLTAEQLKALPDKMFGLPKERKWPLPDKEHVIKAIQFFHYCPKEKKPELAKNINRRAKELKMRIKVQPSSAFYKYADKSIIKENFSDVIVSEFHIGQLSPIVPLSGAPMKKVATTEVSPIDRIRNLWNTKKSISKKAEETLEITKEELVKNPNSSYGRDLFITSEALSDLVYMTESDVAVSAPSEISYNIFNDASGKFRSYKERKFDIENKAYVQFINMKDTQPIDSFERVFREIGNPLLRAAALSYVSYSIDFNPSFKRDLIARLRSVSINRINTVDMDNRMANNKMILKDLPKVINVPEEVIAKIDSLMRLITSSPDRIFCICRDLYFKKYGEDELGGCVYGSAYAFMADILNFINDNPNYGLYLASCNINTSEAESKNPYFIYNKCGNYVAYPIIFTNEKDPSNRTIFLVKVITEDEEYNKLMIGFLSDAKMNFKVQIKRINVKINMNPSLEASDFFSTMNNINIDSNGNISSLLGIDRSWREKFTEINSILKRNNTDSNFDFDAIKFNLCYLFTMIVYIHRKYVKGATPDEHGSEDAQEAIKVMDDCINLFKMTIKDIVKLDARFSFVRFYLDSDYNNHLFLYENDDELESKLQLDYQWIMS